MSSTATTTATPGRGSATRQAVPSERPTRALERWLAPTELERRLEAHLLIARRLPQPR